MKIKKSKTDVALRVTAVTSMSALGVLGLVDSRVWAEPKGALEEVVVTTTRRDEYSQSVPLALTAVTAESATALGITDTQSLAGAIPGLTFNRQANSSVPFLRGIGSPVGGVGSEPSVALYVDDVYMPNGTASITNFNSIQSMEVAKGPQGTLFGRNATGGVVQVHTKNPNTTPALDIEAGYGNYDAKSISLYATGPLMDKLSANIALYKADQDEGWGKNLYTGNDTYTGWDYGGRAKLLWEPTEKISALLTFDFDRTRTDQGVVYRPADGTEAVPGFGPAPGYYDANSNIDSESIVSQHGTSLDLSADFDWATVVSITAYRDTNTRFNFSYDPVPIPLANVDITETDSTWTQELRLLSPEDLDWSWIVGAFYFKDEAAFDPLEFTGLAFAPAPFLKSYGFVDTRSWSVFGQTTYPILEDTNLTLGLRYTRDERELKGGADFGNGVFVPAANSPQSETWSKATYRLVLDHHFTPDLMAYVGYNRGFKSGMFNPVLGPGAPIAPAVEPETLDAYTLGAKSEFWDHRLRVNVEGFYYKDKNLQVSEVNGAATFITNAAQATIKGVDLDITLMPLPQLTLNASLEVLDSTFDSFPNGQYWVYNAAGGGNCAFPGGGTNGPALCNSASLPPGYDAATGNWDLGGNKTIQAPPFSSFVSAAYQIPSAIGEFDVNVGWTHTGNYYSSADNGEGQVAPSSPGRTKQGIINTFNSSIGWKSADARWTARLWIKNLTGEEYWSYADIDAFTTFSSAAPPRTYGLNVGAHW